MAVYKRTYKAYQGPLTPAWSRFTVLSRYELATLFNSRLFMAYTVLCFLPFLIGMGTIYVVNSSTIQLMFHARFNPNLIDNWWFFIFVIIEAAMGFILATWSGPGMVTKDLSNHSLQLYLSRPLSRTEYILGKVSALWILLSCTTWIPALFLFCLQAQLIGNGWIWRNLWLAGAIILSCLIGIAIVSLIAVAISAWVKWRVAATLLMIGLLFLLPALAAAIRLILRSNWGHVIDFPSIIVIIWAHLFRIHPNPGDTGFDLIPLWATWTSALGICAFCFWLLDRKLRAREVESA